MDAPYSFINASCVTDLDLEVEAFREAMCGCSSLGCKVRADRIGRDCELEISKILLMGGGGGGGGGIASSRVWVHGMVIHHSW